jgi:exopolysaccharide biosynthesis polyprenyl glycosylphosphotransferase
MSIADTARSSELLENLLHEPKTEPAERVKLLRRRLQTGLRATELVAGGVGGATVGVIVNASTLGAVVAIVSFTLAWRFLGSIAGTCTDPDPRPWTSTLDKANATLGIALVLSWLTLGTLSVLDAPHAIIASIASAGMALLVSMNGRGLVQSKVMRSQDVKQRTVIIGSGVVAAHVVQRLELAPHLALETIGLVDDDVHVESSPDLPRLGRLQDLGDILKRYDVDRVIVAFSRSGHDELLRCIRTCWDNRVAVDIVPRLFEFLDGARTIDQVGGMPMLSITLPQMSSSARAVKRVSDIVMSVLMLTAIFPLHMLIALAIKLDSRGPIFFSQKRVGRDGRVFRVFKYRSMFIDADARKQEYAQLNDATDGVMFKIHDDPRITRVGRFLRRTSLDELPQLINVLRGEMSLVGPRPLIAEETAAFKEPWHQRRLDLRPGLTGPWQIYGRSDIPFQDMLRFDYQYVAGWSLGRDLKIVLATIPVLYSGRGAY